MDKNDKIKLNDFLIKSSPGWTASYISDFDWRYAPHLAMIDKALTSLSKGEIRKLMINMPPRHGKSMLISQYFPFWYIGNNPSKHIMLVGYSQGFAERWGRKVKSLIESHGKELFGIGLSRKKKSSHEFEIAGYGGSMECIGSGGSITGKGANLMIIDDPVKNEKDSGSELQRNNLWDWYRSTAFTRLEPDGGLVVVMTRWHKDDLCGRLAEHESDWEIISLPALAEDNDQLGRKEDEALWPERFSKEKLEEIRQSMGSYWFSAMYQQNPIPPGGTLFRQINFRYFTTEDDMFIMQSGDRQIVVPKDKCTIMATMDLAISTSEQSDYTVVLVFAVTPESDILLMDVIREKIEGSKHLDLLKKIVARYNPVDIGIEAVQYQSTLIQTALNSGMQVTPLIAKRDKYTRAHGINTRLEGGKVWFRKGAPWLDCFEDELLGFPLTKHDDQVDAFAYIAQLVAQRKAFMPISAKTEHKSHSGILEGFK